MNYDGMTPEQAANAIGFNRTGEDLRMDIADACQHFYERGLVVGAAVKSSVEAYVLVPDSVNNLVSICHSRSKDAGWWDGVDSNDKNVYAAKLALIHSEVSESLEGDRKDLMDDHLPHRKMAEVELADTIIRICDLAGAKGFDLGGAMAEKLEYNSKRKDHTREARAAVGGKKI